MKKDTKAAATEVVGGQSAALVKQLASAVRVMREEMRQTTGQASNNAAASLAALKQFKDLQRLDAKAQLTPDQAERLLKAVNESRKEITKLQASNSNLGNRAKGTDGLSITERLRKEADQLATQDSVVKLLQQINEAREQANKEKADEHRNLKTTLRQGLSAFLGPAGPLIETFASLKDEYGEDAAKIGKKISKWMGLEKDLLKEYEKEAGRNERRDKKLFGMLSDKFRKFSGLLGGNSILDKIGDFFGFGSKTGKGKGGVLTKTKRVARNVGNKAKGLFGRAGGALGKIGSRVMGGFGKVAGAAGKVGGGILRFGGRLLGPIGAALGVASILGDKDAGAKGEDGVDTSLSYGGGALTGASTGAMIGSVFPVVGTVIGGAIGAVVGLLFTGVVRNWTAFKDKVKQTWTGITDTFDATWKRVKAFGSNFVDFGVSTYDKVKAGLNKMIAWIKSHLPGFDKVKEVVAKGTDAVITAGKNGAKWAGDAAKTSRNYVSEAAVATVETAKKVSTDARVAVAGATQTGANKVSEVLDPVAKTLADSKSPVNAAMGSAAATLSKSAQGVAAFAGKMAMPDKDIKSAILGAADKVGVDKGYMMAMTAQESSFNPNAKAKTSSAKGLNQFIDGTWKSMVDKYGTQYGIGMNDQFDPKKNAMMGALFARDNAKTLQGQGHDVSSASLYAAHMLGSGGANQLLSAIKKNPGSSAVDLMPKAAAANRGVFYNRDGTPRTVKEVYAYYQDKIESRAQAYNNALSKETGSSTQMAGAIAPSAEKTPAAAVSQSVAPATDAFERAESVTPDAHITMAPDADTKSGTNRAYGNGGVETRQTAATDVPFVLGDNHMVVINAGMMGA